MPTTQQIVVGSLAVLATSAVGYAAYFDYRRRNDPEFRKKLSEWRKKAFDGFLLSKVVTKRLIVRSGQYSLEREHKKVHNVATREARENKAKTTQVR
jgi:hypothetical protein